MVAATWAEVLQVERVSRHDDFFALGGHSLLAMTAVGRLRKVGLVADVRALFATSTLAGWAAAMATASPTAKPAVVIPKNGIPRTCTAITPAMLPLIALTAEEIARVVATVPGGAANVQDIYPLAPLQEGILFHHLLRGDGDPYLLITQLTVDSRARLDRYIAALQSVVARHDILRTAMVWEGLAEPVQVVWRRAPVPVEEVTLDPAGGDIAEQLRSRFHPRRFRIDVRQAPLLRLYVAHDPVHDRWGGGAAAASPGRRSHHGGRPARGDRRISESPRRSVAETDAVPQLGGAGAPRCQPHRA